MAKNNNKQKKTATQSNPEISTPSPKSTSALSLEQWLDHKKVWILALLFLVWGTSRYQLFDAVANDPIRFLYLWDDSDNRFFDDWAKRIAGGDLLGREAYHPYHTWHREFADYYFEQNPEKKQEILDARPNRDSTFVPGRVLWDRWYGGNTFHQEPFYPYLLALIYKMTGDGPYFMLVLQCFIGLLSGLLIWLITRKYFGNMAALLSGVLYLLAGIIVFQETVLLRTTWLVFFSLLNVWTFDRALERRTWQAFAVAGATLGIAYLFQSTFSLFLVGILAIYAFLERQRLPVLARNAGTCIAAFLLIFSPVVIRNAMVGAPLTSISSVGAITFLAANVKEAKTISSWYPEKEKCVPLMDKYNGELGPAAIEAMGQHSLGDYLSLVKGKMTALISGIEFSSNENYYFYRLHAPVLTWAFIRFSLLFALGLPGILFAIYHRKQAWGLYMGLLMQMAILIGFYVCGRLRTPMAALLIPFGAYAIVQAFTIFKSRKEGAIKLAVAALSFYLFYYLQVNYQTFLRSVDYSVLYDKYFLPRMDEYGLKQDWVPASKIHQEFMKYEPEFTKSLRPGNMLRYNTDINLTRYIARHYDIESQLQNALGRKDLADSYQKRRQELLQIVETSKATAK
jgi:4-amino-4-deoxy-L-arabinose transferase-like glycosyltransferase